MHLHELLYFFNIHLNLSNKALRRGQRRKQMHVSSPFLVFFTLQITDSSKRLGHPKKRLIIYRVSKGMCRRQLETAQGFAMFSTSVRKRVEVKKTSRRVGGYCQVPAGSTTLHLLMLPGWRELIWKNHLHIWKIHAKCFHDTSVLILFF